MLIHEQSGRTMSDEQMQQHLKNIIARHGKLVMACSIEMPRIGQVQMFAGIPLRCVRHATLAEAIENGQEEYSLIGLNPDPEDFFFEVEVAD